MMENNENRENDFVDKKEKDNVSNEENALAESKMAEGCDESKECDVSNVLKSDGINLTDAFINNFCFYKNNM